MKFARNIDVVNIARYVWSNSKLDHYFLYGTTCSIDFEDESKWCHILGPFKCVHKETVHFPED